VPRLGGVDADVLMPHSHREPWLHLRAQLRAGELDSRLARGTAPETSEVLFSHARRIVRPRSCAVLASSLRRIAVAPERPRGLSNRVPVAREQVDSARGELVALADRLEQPGPIRVRGVAQVRLLLGDGSGPLYRRVSGRPLLADLRTAAAHL
jgi:hypothetical protein